MTSLELWGGCVDFRSQIDKKLTKPLKPGRIFVMRPVFLATNAFRQLLLSFFKVVIRNGKNFIG
jgi:hypothetical protein